MNIHIKEGEKVVVLGPSGSGKSTMIRCINMLGKPDSGRVIVDGKELTIPNAPLKKIRQEVAMVFQQFNLYPHMNVLENITIAPVMVQGIKKNQAEKTGIEFLDRVGLADKANVYPGQLSGGQQQRVAIARALNMAFVNLGLVPDTGGTYLLVKQLGEKRAMELCATGRPLPAMEAKELGLVYKVVANEELDTATMKLAEKFANGPLISYKNIKRQIYAAGFEDYKHYLDDCEIPTQRECAASADFCEGVKAFMEKRKAAFEGK